MVAYPSIPHAFLAHCERAPTAPCVRFEGTTYSYGQMLDMAARAAGGLYAWGLRRGERVALYLDNSLEFLATYLGTHLAGGIVVLVNTQYRQVELRHILGDSGARICVTDAARRDELARVQPDLPALEVVVQVDGTPHAALAYAELTTMGTPISSAAAIAGEDIALLAYTSGTTGRSKGAMLRHRNLAANSAAVTAAWRWSAADTLLLVLPLFHIHGLGVGVNGTWHSGASLDLRRRFEAAEVCDALTSGAITMFFGVPTMYTRLIAEARARAESKEQRTERSESKEQRTERSESKEPGEDCSLFSVLCPSVRLFVSGSAPLSAQTFAEFEGLFGQKILERYGMTETLMNTTNPYDGERRPGTVGMPFPGQEARIVDVRTRRPLPDGETGEIQVRGPNVCAGYWQRDDATAATFDTEGWFNTGDLGLRSADGYFTINGRAHELIISGGYNIYPREIEEVLLTHPAIAEVAVVGLPDAEMGERVVAAVVRAPGAPPIGADEVIAYCRAHLAGFKKPRTVVFVTQLPRNAMGKIQKHLVKQEMAG